jgi:hypothetical protein
VSRASKRLAPKPEQVFSARLLYIPLALMFALVAVAAFLPERRLWGINHLAFYPLPTRLGLLGFIGLSFVPGIARGFHSFVLRSIGRLGYRGGRGVWTVIILAVVATAVFIALQSSTLLLGDGRLVADNFKHAFMHESTLTTSSQAQILKNESIAKGATLVYYWFSHAAHGLFGWQPLKAMRVFNCLLGGVLVLVILRIVSRTRASPELRMWLVALALTSGAIELFFGYVENYTPLLLFAVLYVASGFTLIERRSVRWLMVTLVALVLTMAMHVEGMLMAPSFVLLLIWFVLRRRGENLVGVATPVLIALILIGTYVAGTYTVLGRHLLRLRTSGESVGVLAPSHSADIVNEILLILPMFPIFVVMAVAMLRSRLAADESGGLFSRQTEWHFALLILVPCLVFLIVFNPRLGMARDWDLFALTSVGLIPVALLVLNRFLLNLRRTDVPLVASPALVMSAVLVLSWIGINSSALRSADRYKSILSYDETFGQYAYETLGKHYYDEGRLEDAIAAMEKAVSFSYNARLHILLGVYYRDAGRFADAAAILRPVLEQEPHNEKVRCEFALLLSRAGLYDELYEVARTGTEYHPENPVFHALYGKMLIGMGRIEEGVEELRTLKELDSSGELVEEVDRIIEELKQDGKL